MWTVVVEGCMELHVPHKFHVIYVGLNKVKKITDREIHRDQVFEEQVGRVNSTACYSKNKFEVQSETPGQYKRTSQSGA